MIEHDSTLIKCGLFLHLEGQVIAEVLSKSEVKIYPKGAVLIEKGTVPTALYIIRRGKVGIYNEDILLAELSELAIMGESFLAEATATATTMALTEVETIEIRKDDFYWLAIKHPRLVFNIFTISNRRLRRSNDAALVEARTREEKLKKLVDERTAELNATLEELRHTQKFRDQFLANMSHEIRTPMNAIVGLTNLLLKSHVSELQDKYLNVIKKSGANLLVIINDILDLAKLEAGKMELEKVPFPLHTALHNIHTILGLKAEEKGINVKLNIAEGVPEYVIGDETRITQVIMNLTGNAIKFTEKGGVTISASVEKQMDGKKEIRFSVQDTGIGIPADKIDKIFESFGQASADTTRKFGGTGLGLTISKQLVEMHGGQIKVSSVPGTGSDFYFVIAYSEAPKPSEMHANEDAAIQDMKGRKILLVEDNEFNQMVAVDTLHDIFPGIEVDVAENGKTAIEKASANDYSMILMDIQLPDIDGFEITRFIRSEIGAPKNSIRICAMTASVTKERIDQCFEAGMNDYLMKPFTPEALREKVIKNSLGVE
ncbi:MAG TPA: ATP-binding protein [Bacteroidia bacterium]|nr:ATP-binding protein [Bacteroidia bacterium]